MYDDEIMEANAAMDLAIELRNKQKSKAKKPKKGGRR